MKLTSEIALDLVKRIEALKEQINAVYREAADYDGYNNDNIIRDIVHSREAASEMNDEAEGLLASFDAEDDAA